MKMDNQKGFTNVVLIVLVVILAGMVGYFVLRKPTIEPATFPPDNNVQPTQPQVTPPPVNATQTPPPTIPPPSQQTPPASENKKPSVTILFPAGGEILEGGKIYTIQWKTENINPNAIVRIGYGDAVSIVHGCCGDKVTNTGNAQLKTPESTFAAPECGSGNPPQNVSVSYKVGILIKESANGPFVVEAYSNPFTLRTKCPALP